MYALTPHTRLLAQAQDALCSVHDQMLLSLVTHCKALACTGECSCEQHDVQVQVCPHTTNAGSAAGSRILSAVGEVCINSEDAGPGNLLHACAPPGLCHSPSRSVSHLLLMLFRGCQAVYAKQSACGRPMKSYVRNCRATTHSVSRTVTLWQLSAWLQA